MWKSGRGRVATLAVLAFAAACGTTEPEAGAELDAEAALHDYEALDAVLGSSEFSAFRALGDRTPFGGSPAAVEVVAGLHAPSSADGGRAFALELFRRLKSIDRSTRPATAPIISDTHRGSTFVYDPDAGEYRVDPERLGAPDTGVRFIIYDLDAAGVPKVDDEVGHADLIDEGDGSAEDIVLHLIVDHMGTTVLDYRTTLDHNQNRGALTVRGFLRSPNARLDFDIEAVGTDHEGTQTLDVAFEMRIDARDFSIVGSVSGIQEDSEGAGEIDVTVRHRRSSLRVDVRGASGELDGTIFLNGDIFATVSGPADDPTFLGQSGDPLTPLEMLVLHRIFDAIEDVFDFLEDLVDPVDDLVLLGIIL